MRLLPVMCNKSPSEHDLGAHTSPVLDFVRFATSETLIIYLTTLNNLNLVAQTYVFAVK
jgi:hypothetical protein